MPTLLPPTALRTPHLQGATSGPRDRLTDRKTLNAMLIALGIYAVAVAAVVLSLGAGAFFAVT